MKGNDYPPYLPSLDYVKFVCPTIRCLLSKIVKLLREKGLVRVWDCRFLLALIFLSPWDSPRLAKNIDPVPLWHRRQSRAQIQLALHAIANSNLNYLVNTSKIISWVRRWCGRTNQSKCSDIQCFEGFADNFATLYWPIMNFKKTLKEEMIRRMLKIE